MDDVADRAEAYLAAGHPARAAEVLRADGVIGARRHYLMAWSLDAQGHEAEALPHYRAADDLPDAERYGRAVGYGSTCRNLGLYDEALQVLDTALAEWPGDATLTAFRALVLHNLGRGDEAVGALLTLAIDGADFGRHARALRFYADRPSQRFD